MMRHSFATTLAGSILLMTGLTASAQYRPPDQDYGRYYDEHDRRVQWASRLGDRVRADLDRADAGLLPFVSDVNGDRARIDRAIQEVNEFQQSWSGGDGNPGRVYDAIAALRTVVDRNALSDRRRDVLSDDLHRLQTFADSQREWQDR